VSLGCRRGEANSRRVRFDCSQFSFAVHFKRITAGFRRGLESNHSLALRSAGPHLDWSKSRVEIRTADNYGPYDRSSSDLWHLLLESTWIVSYASDMLQTKRIGKVSSPWPIISDGSLYATIHLSLAER
jgi:hypothetical protein